MKNYVYILFVSLLTQSCLVVKEYRRPNLDVPEKFRGFKDMDTIFMAIMPWEELFKDPLLRGYIDEALVNNYDQRLSLQNVYRSQALYQEGRAGYIPTLNINAMASSTDFSENSFQGQQASGQGNQSGGGNDMGRIAQYDLTGTLDWEIDLWGGITSNKKATAAAYLQSEAGQRLVKTIIIANVASQYYLLTALDEQLEIAKLAVESRKNAYEVTQKLKQAGQEREVAVQQAGSQLKTAELLALDLKLRVKQAENAMCVLLGKNPQTIERGEIGSEYPTAQINLGIPSALLRNRPDVLQAEYNLTNAFERTNVAKTDFYPKLNLGASAGLRSLNASDWISSASLFNSIMGGLAQPILNRRKLRTNYEVARINQETASLEFKQTLLVAYREVSDALYTYRIRADQYKVQGEQMEFLQNATDYSFKLYQSGLTNYLDVLIADTNKLNAHIELVNLKFDGLQATIDLYRALGGGWNKIIDPAETMLKRDKDREKE